MNHDAENHPDFEARRTLELLEQYPRQEASPWLADRIMARLRHRPETAVASSWQWALATVLLVANGLAIYWWQTEPELADTELAQNVRCDYGLSAELADEETYQFTTPTDF